MPSLSLGLSLPALLNSGVGTSVSSPVISGVNASYNYVENATTTILTASVTGGLAPYTYSKSGVDAAKFAINSSTGALTWVTSPDYETPTDTGADNVYNVTVTVTDSVSQTSSQSTAITVTNVVDTGYTEVQITVDQTLDAAAYTPIAWDSAVSDSLGAWSAGSPTRLTPPATTGYVMLFAQTAMSGVATTGQNVFRFAKNGSGTYLVGGGGACSYAGATHTTGHMSVVSAPIAVTNGDYYTLERTSTDSSWVLEDIGTSGLRSRAQMLVVPPGDVGSLVYLTSDDTALNGASIVSWDATQYALQNMWSAGSPTRLTVPNGVTRVALASVIRFGSTASSDGETVVIHKNGAASTSSAGNGGTGAGAADVAGTTISGVETGPLAVTAGDYFEVTSSTVDTSYTRLSNACFFAMRSVAAPAVRVKMTTDRIGVNDSAGTTLAWDGEDFDDLGAHDNVTNNTRITVPSGVATVRVGASWIRANCSTQVYRARIDLYNSSNVLQRAVCENRYTQSDATHWEGCSSGPVAVSAGDYFVVVATSADTSTDMAAATASFWMEKIA